MTELKERGAWSPQSFCKWADIGMTTFYEEVKAGRLRIKKLGVRTLVLDEDARAWLNSLPDAASVKTREAA